MVIDCSTRLPLPYLDQDCGDELKFLYYYDRVARDRINFLRKMSFRFIGGRLTSGQEWYPLYRGCVLL